MQREMMHVAVAMAALFAASYLLSDPAFAQAGGQAFGRATTILENVLAAFSSTFVKAILSLAIVAFGLGMVMGNLDYKKGLLMCVGAGVMLGASAIAGMMTDG